MCRGLVWLIAGGQRAEDIRGAGRLCKCGCKRIQDIRQDTSGKGQQRVVVVRTKSREQGGVKLKHILMLNSSKQPENGTSEISYVDWFGVSVYLHATKFGGASFPLATA